MGIYFKTGKVSERDRLSAGGTSQSGFLKPQVQSFLVFSAKGGTSPNTAHLGLMVGKAAGSTPLRCLGSAWEGDWGRGISIKPAADSFHKHLFKFFAGGPQCFIYTVSFHPQKSIWVELLSSAFCILGNREWTHHLPKVMWLAGIGAGPWTQVPVTPGLILKPTHPGATGRGRQGHARDEIRPHLW